MGSPSPKPDDPGLYDTSGVRAPEVFDANQSYSNPYEADLAGALVSGSGSLRFRDQGLNPQPSTLNPNLKP